MQLCYFPGCLVGQDLNHDTLKQHPCDCNLSVGLDWQEDTEETSWKHTNVIIMTYTVMPLQEPQRRLSVWITQQFVFTPALPRSVWMTNGGELVNHRCGVIASSPVWKGLLIAQRARSGLEVVSQFFLLTQRDRSVDLSVAISVSIHMSLQPYEILIASNWKHKNTAKSFRSSYLKTSHVTCV